MSTSFEEKLNTTPTVDIARHGLSQLRISHRGELVDLSSTTWEELRSKLPRRPKIFVLVPDVPVGDITPFMRLIHDLAKTLPAQYVLHRTQLDHGIFYDEQAGMGFPAGADVSEVEVDEWEEMLKKSPPDVVLCTQIHLSDSEAGDDEQDFESFMDEACENSGVTIIPVEFVRIGAGTVDVASKKRDLVENDQDDQSRKMTLEEYSDWHVNPGRSLVTVERYRNDLLSDKLPGTVLLECYPAELMTTDEVEDASGILCGHVPPKIGKEKECPALDQFIADSRDADRKIVAVVRGGEVARSSFQDHIPPGADSYVVEDDDEPSLKSIMHYQLAKMLAGGGFSVVAMGKKDTKAMEIDEQLFRLPNLAVDFHQLFPKVDLVIHHGGSGTTMAALQSGRPQFIIPNPGDTPDQLWHGARITTIGCGSFVHPQSRIDQQLADKKPGAIQEMVDKVTELMEDRTSLKEKCRQWKDRIEGGTAVDGMPVALDMARRLVAGAMLAREG